MPKKNRKSKVAEKKSKLILTIVIGGVVILSILLFLLNYVYGPPAHK